MALKNIWGDDDYFMGRSMDVYIAKLRKFLKDDTRVAIVNIPRTGFMLEVSDEADRLAAGFVGFPPVLIR